MKKQINIGDIVSLLDDDIKGKVISINGNEILIEDSDGFERTCSIYEVIVYDTKLANDTTKSNKDSLKKEKKTSKRRMRSDVKVIDLHNTNSHLERNRILQDQIKKFKNHLNRAIGRRELEIVFIHGKGEGILRNEIVKILKKYSIKHEKAPFPKYGEGTIIVYLNGINKIIR